MDEKRLVELRNATVRKANNLIQESRFDLSLQQQKILLYLISQISPYDDEFKTYEFSIADFAKVAGITECGKNYIDIKEAIRQIRNKSVWITMPDGRDSLLAWIEKARIDSGNGIIEIRLDNDMKPFLLHLKQNYTQYELIFTLKFKSKYSIRLYELIKSIHYHELEEYTREFELSELKRLLDAETYKTFQHFKERVIITSVDEINKYSDKRISYRFIKKGRSFHSIVFTITTKGAIETIELRDKIYKELGVLPGQTTFWDVIQED